MDRDRDNRRDDRRDNRDNRRDNRDNRRDDRVWLDVVAFVTKNAQGDKRPQRVGFAFKGDDGKVHVRLQLVPLPGSGWDGSLLIEKQEQRDDER